MKTTIGELVSEVDDRSPPSQAIVFSVSEKYGIVPQTQLFRKEIATDDRSKYRSIRYGDVVYNPYLLWNRAVGACFDHRGGCVSPAYIVLRPREPDTERYLHYFFRSDLLISTVDSIAVGSVTRRRTAPVAAVLSLAFELPELTLRQSANSVLAALDNRIELNWRSNDTLEAMGRALFKAWFVDFVPVRANASGLHADLPKSIAHLFSDSFEGSALGEIPKGWRTARLGELLELKRGYDLPSQQRRDGKVPIVSSSGPTGSHDEAKARAPGIVTGRYGTIGKVFFMCEDYWPLNTTLYVRRFKDTDPIYAYYLLQLVDFHKFSDKAAVPGVNRNHLHDELVIVPPIEIVKEFGRLAGAWLSRQASNARQCSTLAALRDALVPKLIFGQLRINEVERMVSDVA